MMLQMVRAMLGPFVFIADWATANPLAWGAILFVWTGVWALGKVQQQRIANETTGLVLDMSHKLLAEKPTASAQDLYKAIYPVWAASLPRWAKFVPHRLEMWPVPARPEAVQQQLQFSPEWISRTLAEHEIQVQTVPTPDKPKRRKRKR